MTYTNAEKMIKNAPQASTAGGLERVLRALGNPEKKMGVIKVFGESGKSSVCALISTVLSAAGYKVGRLVTPVIHSVTASVSVCERPISITDFTNAADEVRKTLAEERKIQEDGIFELSSDDLFFATAFTAFYKSECNLAVIEIPTSNTTHTAIDKSLLSVIATIHSAAAAHSICSKIDRNCGEVVTATQAREIHDVIFNRCVQINTRLTFPLKSSFHLMSSSPKRSEFTYKGQVYSIACGALYQIDNFITVLEASDALRRCGLKIHSDAICASVFAEGLSLRFEMISIMPTVIIDRADSKDKLEALSRSLIALNNDEKKPLRLLSEGMEETVEFLRSRGINATTVALPEKGERRAIREILKELSTEDVLTVTGSSAYCERISEIIKQSLL